MSTHLFYYKTASSFKSVCVFCYSEGLTGDTTEWKPVVINDKVPKKHCFSSWRAAPHPVSPPEASTCSDLTVSYKHSLRFPLRAEAAPLMCEWLC